MSDATVVMAMTATFITANRSLRSLAFADGCRNHQTSVRFDQATPTDSHPASRIGTAAASASGSTSGHPGS